MKMSNGNTGYDYRGGGGGSLSPVALTVFVLFAIAGWIVWTQTNNFWNLVGFIVVGGLVAWSIKVADQWQRVVVLRLGKFKRLAGPGIFMIIPILDEAAIWLDMRVRTVFFTAEKTLTKDNVPVNVDAVMFWTVVDPMKAALEVEDYQKTVVWAAQTALRDIIGRTELYEMLVGREQIDEEIKRLIDQRTNPWGVSVRSVEIRDVVIPPELQDAMSREAQAERERRARLILGTAELQVSEKFSEASKLYQDNPIALNLRAMNILYEGIKERGALVIVPSDMVASLNAGSVLGYVSTLKDGKGMIGNPNTAQDLPASTDA
jgi:regulator of protease activity HflC (stomatin/prohibitin superfamily)